MLKDCLEVFKGLLKEHGDKIIIDNHIPADGTYLIVNIEDGSYKKVEIKQDKKTKEIDKSVEFFKEICIYDYNSKLVDMNKPISDKMIQSNNYLSFFIKKDSLINEDSKKSDKEKRHLTNDIIDKYYDILANPLVKYKKKNARELYNTVVKEVGNIDLEILEKNRKWIKDNIFKLKDEIEIKGKNYLKIFFENPIKNYEKENKRYLMPNIYNSVEHNQMIGDVVWGLSNNNMGLSIKKPFLENKTRRNKVPYLIEIKEAVLQQKFFDYIANLAAAGKVNIYIDSEIKALSNKDSMDSDFSGNYLRLKRGKTLLIQDYDIITSFRNKLKKKFVFKNILKNTFIKDQTNYGEFETLTGLENLINEVLFYKCLKNHYFTDYKDMSINNAALKNCIISYRQILFNWFHKGNDTGIYPILNKISTEIIKDSINNNNLFKLVQQFNLKLSLVEYFEGGRNMEEINNTIRSTIGVKINSLENEKISFSSDEEYYFGLGQIIYYLLSKNKSTNKRLSLLNPFINTKNNRIIKERVNNLFKKYNHEISDKNFKFKNLYKMILSYETNNLINTDMIIAGYLNDNLLYEKKGDRDNE